MGCEIDYELLCEDECADEDDGDYEDCMIECLEEFEDEDEEWEDEEDEDW